MTPSSINPPYGVAVATLQVIIRGDEKANIGLCREMAVGDVGYVEKGREEGEEMKAQNDYGYPFAHGGIHCPLCGARMPRGSYFCGHCRRGSRLHLDVREVRVMPKEPRLPRGILKNGLRHSA